ncbi:hypothetical protein G5I_01460 [Acromyrmex echinatior]|uniref:Uncharacterized protein n=1 Tax=Acromyrmex echinatior TaxID=103372 RepID=F4W7P4_ACREC|nr:hypothetical protein G5I_01460 [Acromyrmex echinatior]
MFFRLRLFAKIGHIAIDFLTAAAGVKAASITRNDRHNIGKAYEATFVMHFTMHVSGTVYAFFQKKKAYEFSFFEILKKTAQVQILSETQKLAQKLIVNFNVPTFLLYVTLLDMKSNEKFDGRRFSFYDTWENIFGVGSVGMNPTVPLLDDALKHDVISMDSRRSLMDSAVEVAMSFKGSCGNPSLMKIELITKTTPGAVPLALLRQAKDITCERSPQRDALGRRPWETHLPSRSLFLSLSPEGKARERERERERERGTRAYSQYSQFPTLSRRGGKHRQSAHTHTRTTEEINRIILDAKRPMEMSLRQKFTHRRRTTTTSRISNCPVLTSHDAERESCDQDRVFLSSSRARRGSETKALTMILSDTHSVYWNREEERDRVPKGLQLIAKSEVALFEGSKINHHLTEHPVSYYLVLLISPYNTEILRSNWAKLVKAVLLSNIWVQPPMSLILTNDIQGMILNNIQEVLSDWTPWSQRFVKYNSQSRAETDMSLRVFQRETLPYPDIIYDLSFTLRFSSGTSGSICGILCKALLFTIDLVSCRDVFRAALADEISLNKEYTVLVDYAIVSSVEKEADKTDLRDSRFDKAQNAL